MEGVAEDARINSCLELKDSFLFVFFGFLKICVCLISHGNGHMSTTLLGKMSSAVPPSESPQLQQGEIVSG